MMKIRTKTLLASVAAITRHFVHIFKIWMFLVNGQKNGPKLQKILSNAFNISGTIYQMIIIYGTHV